MTSLVGLPGAPDFSFTELDELLETWNEGRLLREGVRVAILGRPNAENQLLNALIGFVERLYQLNHPRCN